jgi:hypothetical protein
LAELDRQAQVIDGMQRNLDAIDHHLDHAQRDLRAIESIGGAFANKITADPSPRHSRLLGSMTAAAPQHKSATIVIPCVFKHSNDALELARLRVNEEGCEVVSVVDEKVVLDKWVYGGVGDIIVRARPLHLDINFRGDTRVRVRLVSAYIQRVVNELALRCSTGGRALPVVFERGALRFPLWSRVASPRSRSHFLNWWQDQACCSESVCTSRWWQ